MRFSSWLGSETLNPAEILHLYRREAINPNEYKRAIEWATQPPAPSQWKSALRHIFLISAVLLIISGIILFGAYNWEALPRLSKLALVQVLILGFWLFSRLRPADSLESTSALWGSALLVGAHMAVFGQVYQTGADSFVLFAAWSALIIPWCLAGRTNILWLTQAVLLNLAFSFFFFQRVSDEFPPYAMAFGAFNVVLAACWEKVRKSYPWMSPSVRTLLLTAALVPLTGASCVAPWEGELYALCFLANVLLITGLVKSFPDEFQMMGAVASSGLTLCGALISRILIQLDIFGLFLIALSLLGLLTPTVKWLRRVHAQETTAKSNTPTFLENDPALQPSSGNQDPAVQSRLRPSTSLEILESQGLLEQKIEERHPVEPDAPFYLGCLTAMGAWIASLFLLAFIIGLSISEETFLTFAGFLLWGASIRGRKGELSEFFNHLFFATHMAGGFMVVGGLAEILDNSHDAGTGILVIALLLQLASLALFPDTVARGLVTLGVVITGGCLGHKLLDGPGMSVWLLLVAAALTSLLSIQQRWLLSSIRDFYRPVLNGSTLGLLVMIGLHSFAPRWVWGGEPVVSWLLVTGLGLLTAYAAYQSRAPIPALLALLVLDAVTFSVPGLSAAILVFILAFQAKNDDLFRLALIATLVYGIQYYYDLDFSFLLKSITLIASGLILLATRRALKNREGLTH